MVLNMQLWRKKPLLLYYFVLSQRNIAQVPLITPFLSRWNIPKPDVLSGFYILFHLFLFSQSFVRTFFSFLLFRHYVLLRPQC